MAECRKCNVEVRLMALFLFILDVAVLSIVLALLWAMRSKEETCVKLCLPDAYNGEISCICQAERLENYLSQRYLISSREARNTTRNGSARALAQHVMKYNPEWNMKPVAHLAGSKLTNTESVDYSKEEMAPVREWEQSNNCFLQNGMTYRNGRLVVPIKGLYHVYSFIDMYQSYSPEDMKMKEMKKSISMGVFRSNILKSKVPEEIMLCTYRPYERSRNNVFTVYDNYIGADVQLDAGDEVYIKVSNLSYVRNPSRNVFGMHLL